MEFFSDQFWYLLHLAVKEPVLSDSISDLDLEHQGYIEKRLVSTIFDEQQKKQTAYREAIISQDFLYQNISETAPLLGNVSPKDYGKQYRIYITRKGKNYIKACKKLSPKDLSKKISGSFAWGTALLAINGSKRFRGFYQMAETETHDLPISERHHGDFKSTSGHMLEGLVSLGIAKNRNVDITNSNTSTWYTYSETETNLSRKGKQLLRLLVDISPAKFLAYMLRTRDHRGSSMPVVASIENLQLVINEIRKIRPDDWFKLIRTLEPITTETNWRGNTELFTEWHRQLCLNLVLVAKKTKNFKLAVQNLKLTDWDLIKSEIDPAIINILAGMKSFQEIFNITPVQALATTAIIFNIEEDTTGHFPSSTGAAHQKNAALPERIRKLFRYQPSFSEAVKETPITEWATILCKVNPGVRNIIAQFLKAHLANSES